MSLLPNDHKDFATKDYWNGFFEKQKSGHFEWYGEYEALSKVLHKYIQIKDKMLVIGCGNSKLSADLYDVGLCNSISIDISEPVIKQMQQKYGKDRPKMTFECMDVLDMDFKDEEFSVVLDKGTLDALMVDESDEALERIDKMFSEINRVLRYGGRYLCFSLLQEHVLNMLLRWFIDKGWFIRIHRCTEAEDKRKEALAFPVYGVIVTKMRKIENMKMVLEMVHGEPTSTIPHRCTSFSEVTECVKSAQHYAFLKSYLSTKKVVNDDICLELCAPETRQVKYKMYVVDSNESYNCKFAIFIVPQGRESEWIYACAKGRRELAASAKVERFIVVHLNKDLVYGDLEEMKADISDKVLELAPSYFKEQVPIMSLVETEAENTKIKFKSTSEISGEFVVKDVFYDEAMMFRELVFLSNPTIVQSEARLIIDKCVPKKKKKGTRWKIDADHLSCNHHVLMVSGFAFLEDKMLSPKILLIGLGGGNLAVYVHNHFPNACIDAIELDPNMLEVGKNWFGLVTDDRLKVHIKDGLVFVQEAVEAGTKYDTIILDVDNKDLTLGMTSPPVAFLEKEVLHSMKKVIHDDGVIMTTLSCRNPDMRTDALLRLRSIFKLFFMKSCEDVNEVVYCLKHDSAKDMECVVDHYSSLISFLNNHSSYRDVKNYRTALKEIL